MASQRSQSKPAPKPVDAEPPVSVSPAAGTVTLDPAAAAVEDASWAVMIEIPLRAIEGYATRSLRDLSRHEARILRNAAAGLRADGHTLANAKPIYNASDVISWICEQLAGE